MVEISRLVEPPPPGIVGVTKVQAVSPGRLLQERATGWVKPVKGVMVTVTLAALPTPTVMGDGVTVMVKFVESGGGSGSTIWMSTAEVLGPVAVSPLKIAVMGWLPAVSVLVMKVATPFASVPVPRGVIPSRKVTVPVGVVPAAETVAVKVTGLLKMEALGLEVRMVAVGVAGMMVWMKVGEAEF
jgi:hypothetical protein